MPIPKIIYQTFKTSSLPLLVSWHIARIRKRNRDYAYEFYDDERIDRFIYKEFDSEVYELYCRLGIGAAKADFFRYAVLFKYGGVYLDIDSSIQGSLNNCIGSHDSAIISKEKCHEFYVQWALIYEAGHPFLKKTLELVCDNIRHNRYPHDVHKMTGPYTYTNAINACLSQSSAPPHRLIPRDYDGHLKFKYPLSKLLYKNSIHWKKEQKIKPVLIEDKPK